MNSQIFKIFTFLVFTIIYCNAQNINIPDPIFKYYLTQELCIDKNGDGRMDDDVDTNDDGEVDLAEALLLKILNIPSLQIQDLKGIEYFTNLEYIQCSEIEVDSISLTNLSKLEYLDCTSIGIKSIDLNGAQNLKRLVCYDNNLSKLDLQFVPQLEELQCGSNKITKLDLHYCPNLRRFDCDYNRLTNLDLTNFSKLEFVNAQWNFITAASFENSPNIIEIVIDHNELTNLSLTDNSKLERLYCGDNKLTSLELKDISPMSILFCNNNLLTSIDLKTVIFKSRALIDFRENPNLRYICCDVDFVADIDEVIRQFNIKNIEVNSYCSKEYNQNINKIHGIVRYDIDKNNCNANALTIPNYVLLAKDAVSLNPPPQYFATLQNGSYEISKRDVSGNLYSNVGNKLAFKSDPEFYPYSFTSTNETLEQNFCIKPIGDYNDLEVSIVPLETLIPGGNVKYKVLVHNKGNKISNGELSFDFDNTRMQFMNSSQSPVSIIGGKVKWIYSNILPFGTMDFDINLRCNSPVEAPPVNVGDTLRFAAAIKSQNRDETSLDTNFVLNQLAHNSSLYNTVECLQGDVLSIKRIGEYLHYMVKYKNNNTSVIPNIFVQSQIDTNLFNLRSLQVLSTSNVTQMHVFRGNMVEFTLWDLNMMPGDSGYIFFKIKPKPAVTVGNVLKIVSKIYFEVDNFTNLNDVNVLVDYPNFYDKIVFQDSNFRKALVSSKCVDTNNDFIPDSDADLNNDGEVQVSEAIKVEKLFLARNKIKSLKGVEHFCMLNYLDFNENEVDSLELTGLGMLTLLQCHSNKIKSIDLNGSPLLEKLTVFNNSLTSLDLKYSAKLKYLYCYNNNIDSLDLRFLPDLLILDCSHNQLIKIDLGKLNKITTLKVQNNKLENIELQELNQLDTLNVGTNLLVNLSIPNSKMLKYLNCMSNKLQDFDLLELKELIHLDLAYNQINSIDLNEQTNLLNLYCNDNPLSALDILKLSKLKVLNCNNTKIEILSIANSKDLMQLDCSSTSLYALLLKNGANELPDLNISGNDFLKYICCEDKHIEQVNIILERIGKIDCNVNSYCSFNEGGKFYNVNGISKFNKDNLDCTANDPGMPFVKYVVNDSSQSAEFIFDYSGQYRLFLTEGEHTIKPKIGLENYFRATPDSLTVKFPGANDTIVADFCFKPNGYIPDAKVIIVPKDPVRPGFPTIFNLVFSNVGSVNLNGDVLFEYDEKILKLTSASIPPDVQTTNTLLWHFTDLSVFESRTISFTLLCNSPMNVPPVNNDDILKFVATIKLKENDNNLSNNIFVLNSVAVGALDPNDLTCLEGDFIPIEQVGKSLHYLCRFENIGKYSAQNIVIKHDLDTQYFDLSSVEVLDVSHKSWSRFKNSNTLEFIFENINLPFDTLSNKGFILYKINTRADLQVNDTIRNVASIYFDFNFPVVTNTTKTVVGFPTSTKIIDNNTAPELFPNPAYDILYLPLYEGLAKYEIFDINGRMLSSDNVSNNNSINISGLKCGTYIIKVSIGNRTHISKFIKM